ncbi:MAG: putative YjhG/YagF family dehydratase [Yoonia sp.]|jgi:putative YjhG/YagF family dehydratase
MSFADEYFAAQPESIYDTRTCAPGPSGELPLTSDQLLNEPSGNIFGWTQNAGMGWRASELGRKQFVILSSMGGMRAPDGSPIALGYHTGHWEIGLLVKAAAEEFTRRKAIPFAAYCSDPCDGRSQGTTAMFDSLPFRNDAAQVFRRQARSLPTRSGTMGIATCDKGLPAMLMALAGLRDEPVVVVPGGVTLPAEGAEDLGTVQTLGARYSHGLISLEHAQLEGCRACGTPGGGCQFMGTAATAQVIGEALGLSIPHTALSPSGEPVWKAMAEHSAAALLNMEKAGITSKDVLTQDAIHNSMVLHAAFGGSTNLLLHIPAIAHAAGLQRPSVEDWNKVNRAVPRLVSVLPNGPVHHPTVRVFLAGGVPEVMLHLRDLGLLRLDVLTATGETLSANLDAWANSERRERFKALLQERDNVSPDEVIMSPKLAREHGMTSTVTFPIGNIAPEGSVIKSTAIDPSVVDDDGVYRKQGPAKVFSSEKAGMAAIKAGEIKPNDIMVIAGIGPMGTGMEETYQVTSALKHLPFGKEVALITDARFSGVSTGACLGHVGPEALAGGPIGKLQNGDTIRIEVDRENLTGTVNFLGTPDSPCTAEEGAKLLAQRSTSSEFAPNEHLPADTRLWAVLQAASGGTWGGCVFDVDEISRKLNAT